MYDLAPDFYTLIRISFDIIIDAHTLTSRSKILCNRSRLFYLYCHSLRFCRLFFIKRYFQYPIIVSRFSCLNICFWRYFYSSMIISLRIFAFDCIFVRIYFNFVFTYSWHFYYYPYSLIGCRNVH
jgi:hypothetical protein